MTQYIIEAPVAQNDTDVRALQGHAPTPTPHQRPLTIVESAARSGATPEQLVQLFQLQRDADNHQLELMREKRRMDEEDRKRAAELAFRADFSGFRGENIIAPKNKYVDRGRAGSFMQAEYHGIAQLLSPALSKHGFSFRHDQKFGAKPWPLPDNPNNVIGWVWVTCYLEHKDGHVETLELEGPVGDQSANTAVQNMQLTASYLKRQSLLAITGTATGGEDDENSMRGKFNRREPDADAGDPDEVDALLDVGREKSTQGMAALTAWWGALTEPQRKALTPEFAGLRKAARQFDEGGR